MTLKQYANKIGIDAKEKFYSALSGVTDPEKKRKVITERKDFIMQNCNHMTLGVNDSRFL